ncbi:4-oxalocrotonate tautomerase family protein [Paraburkholderia sp. BR14374]|uniref:4-oxalocrotonate tautomerase family protein n=1 Tax=Paraburkholderia sp. BR14374 TaxID=3237007 RepID=UPI0034CDAD77
MPFVHVQTIDGILSDDQKAEMLRRITDLMVEIEGRGDPSFRSSVWVRIDEQRRLIGALEEQFQRLK